MPSGHLRSFAAHPPTHRYPARRPHHPIHPGPLFSQGYVKTITITDDGLTTSTCSPPACEQAVKSEFDVHLHDYDYTRPTSLLHSYDEDEEGDEEEQCALSDYLKNRFCVFVYIASKQAWTAYTYIISSSSYPHRHQRHAPNNQSSHPHLISRHSDLSTIYKFGSKPDVCLFSLFLVLVSSLCFPSFLFISLLMFRPALVYNSYIDIKKSFLVRSSSSFARRLAFSRQVRVSLLLL